MCWSKGAPEDIRNCFGCHCRSEVAQWLDVVEIKRNRVMALIKSNQADWCLDLWRKSRETHGTETTLKRTLPRARPGAPHITSRNLSPHSRSFSHRLYPLGSTSSLLHAHRIVHLYQVVFQEDVLLKLRDHFLFWDNELFRSASSSPFSTLVKLLSRMQT